MFVELNQYLFYRLLGSSVSVSQFRVDRHLHGFLGNHGLRLVKLVSKPLTLVVVEDSNFLGVTVAWCLLLCAVTFMSTF